MRKKTKMKINFTSDVHTGLKKIGAQKKVTVLRHKYKFCSLSLNLNVPQLTLNALLLLLKPKNH